MYTKAFSCATQSLDMKLKEELGTIDQTIYYTAAYLGATVIIMYAPKSF